LRTTYELFLKRVADGRHQTPDKIDAVAQGRVWTGRRARELGLVDELGGLDAAIKIAAQQAKLDTTRPVTLDVYPAKRSLYDLLSSRLGSTGSTTGGLDLLLRRPEVRAAQAAVSMLQLFRRGEPLAILPNVFMP
jgi:protease-4